MALPHIQFDASQAATTTYYPTNGVGGWATGTLTDALNLDWETTELRRLVCPGSTAGAQHIEFYHGDGTLAFETGVQAQPQQLDVKWDAGEGPELRGAWTIQFPGVASATDQWFIQFERTT